MIKEETNLAIKEMREKYFLKDTRVMIDQSFMRIKGSIFFVYDLIFFGNKIIISTSTLKKIEKNKKKFTNKILADNCKYLLENIQNDKNNNYQIIDIDNNGENEVKNISLYLKNNSDVIYLMENQKLYNKLKEYKVEHNQLKIYHLKTKIRCYCKGKIAKFKTLGYIEYKNGKMFLKKDIEQKIVKLYDLKGEEKKNNSIELDDIILVRIDKNIIKSFNLYVVVNNHTRNQVIKLIWTDIYKNETSNFYIDRLDEKYKKIILKNI